MRKWALFVLCFLAFGGLDASCRADPLDNWSWRYPVPQGSSLYAVTYANGQFVAVGAYGTIVTSPNGSNWTVQTFGKFPNLYGVGGAAGVFVAVGDGGTILTSANGANWVQQVSPTSNTLRGVAGNSNYAGLETLFTAVGDNGAFVSTTDATNWTLHTQFTTNTLRAGTYENGSFISVGDGVYTLTSGVVRPSATNYLLAVLYINGKYVYGGGSGTPSTEYDYGQFGYPELAGGAEILFSQSNLSSTWSNAMVSAWCPNWYFAVSGLAYGNNTYVGVGYTAFTLENNYAGIVTTSTDATNWTAQSIYCSPNYLYGVTFGKGVFVAVGDAGEITVSPDGTNWSDVCPNHRTAITAIVASSNFCVASGIQVYQYPYGLDPTTLISSNGVDWVVSTTNLPPMLDLATDGHVFAGVSGCTIYSTTNGYDWSGPCFSANFHGISYGGGQFTAVGDDGVIVTSSNGLNWLDHSLPITNSFYCAVYANGVYLAQGGATAISTDAQIWSLFSTNPSPCLTRIVCANGKFVGASMYQGTEPTPFGLLSSTDGLTWQTNYSLEGANSTSLGLAYANGSFLALAGTNIFKSKDGVNWTPGLHSFPWMIDYNWILHYGTSLLPGYLPLPIALCSFKDTFLMGGMDGIIMQSGSTTVSIAVGSAKMTPSGFNFSFNPANGAPFRVQASSNLVVWSDVLSGNGTGSPTNFNDPSPGSSSARYFRVVSP